jgi:hypothetical protein
VARARVPAFASLARVVAVAVPPLAAAVVAVASLAAAVVAVTSLALATWAPLAAFEVHDGVASIACCSCLRINGCSSQCRLHVLSSTDENERG